MKPIYYGGKFAWAYKAVGDIDKWIINKVSHDFGRIVFEAFEFSNCGSKIVIV